MTQHICPEDAGARAEWGCDAEVPKDREGRWDMVCWRCVGRKDSGGLVCETCNGAGLVRQRRCPTATLDREGRGLWLAYQRFKAYQVLPTSGGLYAQAGVFLKTLELCDGAIAFLDRRQAEINDRMREAARNRGH